MQEHTTFCPSRRRSGLHHFDGLKLVALRNGTAKPRDEVSDHRMRRQQRRAPQVVAVVRVADGGLAMPRSSFGTGAGPVAPSATRRMSGARGEVANNRVRRQRRPEVVRGGRAAPAMPRSSLGTGGWPRKCDTRMRGARRWRKRSREEFSRGETHPRLPILYCARCSSRSFLFEYNSSIFQKGLYM